MFGLLIKDLGEFVRYVVELDVIIVIADVPLNVTSGVGWFTWPKNLSLVFVPVNEVFWGSKIPLDVICLAVAGHIWLRLACGGHGSAGNG